MMYILPVIFLITFLKMPSGLVIYWLTNSVLAIGIQLILMRRGTAGRTPAALVVKK
jgi:YidC/Oxa1 family membrane protein insertase